MCSAAQWILSHAILEMPNHWTSLLLKRDKLLDGHTPALRMCALLIRLQDSGGVSVQIE